MAFLFSVSTFQVHCGGTLDEALLTKGYPIKFPLQCFFVKDPLMVFFGNLFPLVPMQE